MRHFVVVAALLAAAVAKPSGVVAPLAAVATPLAAVATPLAAVATPLAAVATPIVASSQYHAQDEIGQYTYGYSNPLSAKSEIKAADGKTVGAYSYVDPDGKLQSVEYAADSAHGFRVAATNLPVAPAVPVVPKLISPEPVKDTAEVVEARSKHLVALKEAEERAKAEADAIVALRSSAVVPAITVGAAPAVAIAAVPAVAVAPAAVVGTRKLEAVPTPADTVKTVIEPVVAVKTSEKPVEAAPAIAKTVEAAPAVAAKTVEAIPAAKTVVESTAPAAVVKTSVTEFRTLHHTPLTAAVIAEPAFSHTVIAGPAIQAYSVGYSPILAGQYLAQPLGYSAHLLAAPALVTEAEIAGLNVEAKTQSIEANKKSEI